MINPFSLANPGRPVRAASPYDALFIAVNANTLTLADGTANPTWANKGTGGSGFDFAPTGTGTNTFVAAASGQPAYMKFTSANGLATSALLPSSFAGSAPRTFGLYCYLAAAGNQNLFGYGRQQSGELFDVVAFSGASLTPHYYGSGNSISGPTLGTNTWHKLMVRISYVSGSTTTNRVEAWLNGSWVLDTTATGLISYASVLSLAAGQYTALNNSLERRIAGFFAHPAALSDADALAAMSLISL